MITASNISLQYGQRKLFSKVNIVFSPGNCYGLIGANGSGKSTFLKILAGEIEPTVGDVIVAPQKRISVLRQDQFAYDEHTVLETVIMGHERLFRVMKEKDEIYAKEDFFEKDGLHASELEAEFIELDGWSAEPDAGKLLSELGVAEEFHEVQMKSLESGQKVRVLLAQALFGNPDILLLDEPTNHLDVATCLWLEEFLCTFENTAIVVTHDRHFLDKVCTHVADIDFGQVQLYMGNYSFWQQASELKLRQRSESNKRVEDKRKELQDFVARFSANASKSRQATSRKKLLEKLSLEEIKPSSRKYPYVNFEQEREAGNDILHVEHLFKTLDGEPLLKDFTLSVDKGDKIAFVGPNDKAKTELFRILMGEIEPDKGFYKWGASTIRTYYPKDNTDYFKTEASIVDWLRQYSKNIDEDFVRGFLGRMLFSGEESLKPVNVLSGGERVRCMLARMMLAQPNVMILDEPTNHLDLESITALNRGMEKFGGTILFSSHDHQLVETVATRIVEIGPCGYIDRVSTTYDEYLSDEEIQQKVKALYVGEK